MEKEGIFEIIGVVDNSFSGVKKLDGYLLIERSKISTVFYDYIIIMSDKFYREIFMEAVKLGVCQEKILPYKTLDLPGINFTQYIELKKSKISIISNNCWGGLVYHTLGMECLSPFKNLYLEDEDYINLLQNLREYLKTPMEFLRYDIDVHSKERYPIMRLGDISVHCNHDQRPEDALENWNRRLKKINYDNLFVELYTSNKNMAEKFISLEQYRNKICFVPFRTNCENMLQLKLNLGQKEFYEAVNSSASLNGNAFYLVDLLLGNIRRRTEK